MNQAANIVLSAVECRVLGALIEKDITTPDYYPLSLNALVNACNQKNNRDPLMSLDENAVRDALYTLQEKRLAGPAGGADSRVTKYEHRIQEVFNFTRAETAVMDVLLLRGPQTPGELRGRTERMYRFEELSDVQATLQKLMQREPSLVKILPRQPGTKESRYAHLLAGDVEGHEAPAEAAAVSTRGGDDERVAQLESEVAELRREVADLKQQMESFRKQFE
ncbi:MAG TPA: YceH family protein [Candidatus Angelobacter sp.]